MLESFWNWNHRSALFESVVTMHRTKILILDGHRTHVDVDVAPLVLALHNRKIQTFTSCQASCMGHCGRRHKRGVRCEDIVTIGFTTTREATKFLNVAHRRSDPEKLRMQVRGLHLKDRWVWTPFIDGDEGCDLGTDWVSHGGFWVPKLARPYRLTFTMLCLFPRKHLDWITERAQG